MRLPKFLRDRRTVQVDDETVITVEHVEKNAAPRYVVALFFMLLAASTIGQQFYFEGRTAQQIEDQQILDDLQDNRLQEQIDYGRQQRILQRDFLVALLNEPDQAKRQEITRQYIADAAALDERKPPPISSPAPLPAGKG